MKQILVLQFLRVNQGNSVLIVEKCRLKLKTLNSNDKFLLYYDNRKYGRLVFPHSVSKTMAAKEEEKNSVLLVLYNTINLPELLEGIF